MSKFKAGDRVRDVSPHASGLGTAAGTIIGKDEGDNWLIHWDATPFSRINWHDHQIELLPNPLQAEIERLRTALGSLLADAPDTLGCGHRCTAEISDVAENSYAISLRHARAALSGSKE